MSRLDSFIRRMSAQRDILNGLPTKLDEVPGVILEFGLGSGRTYDHLRQLFPNRPVIVFELETGGAAAFRVTPATDLLIGDIRETSLGFPDGSAALVHADIETGDAEIDAELASWLPAVVARLLTPGGYAVSGSSLPDDRLAPCSLPSTIQEGRYFLLRRL